MKNIIDIIKNVYQKYKIELFFSVIFYEMYGVNFIKFLIFFFSIIFIIWAIKFEYIDGNKLYVCKREDLELEESE